MCLLESGEGMNFSSVRGRSETVVLSFRMEATYVPQLDEMILQSNRLLGLHVGARWRPR